MSRLALQDTHNLNSGIFCDFSSFDNLQLTKEHENEIPKGLEPHLSFDEFLNTYPTIRREQVVAVLEWENQAFREAAVIQLAG